ncbi:protein MIS12 homolog [Brachionichthys hirsutus]|uniref:protein MIS12 homolog n=1 Tax=Brachionichthys hirsutus TaxID=412623 RepID=UPI003604F729
MARETQGSAAALRGEVSDETDSFSPSSLKLYESQFFGFTPQTCMLRVYSAFQDCLRDVLSVVEKVCVRQLGGSERDGAEEPLRAAARGCSRKLQRFIEDRFKQLSARMEALLVTRCLSVPPNVLLPEDAPHAGGSGSDVQEVLRLESSLSDLQSAHEAEVCARQALLAELQEQKEVQKQLDGILNWVVQLQTAWAREGGSLQLVMESVQKLQEAIREVCDKTPR